MRPMLAPVVLLAGLQLANITARCETVCRTCEYWPRLQVTGHVIKPCRFAVLRDDEVHGWLGASPDGLIDSLSAQPGLTSCDA